MMGAYLLWGTTGSLHFDLVESEDWDLDNAVTEHPVEVGADVTDNVRTLLAQCTLQIFATNEPIGANNWTQAELQTMTYPVEDITQTPPSTEPLTATEWDNKVALRALLVGLGAVGGSAFGSTGALVGGVAGTVAGQLAVQPGPVDVSVPAPPGLQPRQGRIFQAQVFQFATTDDYVAKMIAALETLKTSAQILQVVGSKRSQSSMVIETLKITRDADTGSGASIMLGLKEIRFVQTQTVAAPKPTLPRAQTSTKKGQQNPKDATNQSALKALVNLGQKILATLGGQPATAAVE